MRGVDFSTRGEREYSIEPQTPDASIALLAARRHGVVTARPEPGARPRMHSSRASQRTSAKLRWSTRSLRLTCTGRTAGLSSKSTAATRREDAQRDERLRRAGFEVR